MAGETKKFPSELASRGTVLVTDKLLIHNITTGATEYTTVAALLIAGTKYWSCMGSHFDAQNPDTDDVVKGENGSITASTNGIIFIATVNLPHGATISSIVVYGVAAGETWGFTRITLSDLTAVNKGGAAIYAADNNITDPVIDNSLYAYQISTSSLDTGDLIYGARIAYT